VQSHEVLRIAVVAVVSLLVATPAAGAADQLFVANHAGPGSRLVDLSDNAVGSTSSDVCFAEPPSACGGD
jgi:hypothetical protein